MGNGEVLSLLARFDLRFPFTFAFALALALSFTFRFFPTEAPLHKLLSIMLG